MWEKKDERGAIALPELFIDPYGSEELD
jgi:hypothetical protein